MTMHHHDDASSSWISERDFLAKCRGSKRYASFYILSPLTQSVNCGSGLVTSQKTMFRTGNQSEKSFWLVFGLQFWARGRPWGKTI